MRRLPLRLRRLLERRGYRIVRLQAGAESSSVARVAVGGTPPGAAGELRDDNPRLVELRGRYAAFDSPLCAHTFWSDSHRRHEIDLVAFRGDNAYLWQRRHLGDDAALAYLAYLQHVESFDTRGLLAKLEDDGAFGAWTFDFGRRPVVTRDLLDSVNELYFLDRVFGLLDRPATTVLDIGAGYGRLAHRMSAAAASVERYYCVDAVAESTFLCEYYLRYRGEPAAARVVPVDEFRATVEPGTVDLAVNVHSFSEMSAAAVHAWIAELQRLAVPALFVVPNEPDRLLAIEADGTRVDVQPALEAAGYRLTHREPALRDVAVRNAVGVHDTFWLFQAELSDKA
jgi:hypothetical protein